MQELLDPKSYPRDVRRKLLAMEPLAVSIANRWHLGWPNLVKRLIAAGEYLPALAEQEEVEREVYAAPGNEHLARHEIAEVYGLSAGPPFPTVEEWTEEDSQALRRNMTEPREVMFP